MSCSRAHMNCAAQYDTIYTGAAWQGGPTNPMSGYLFANNRIVGSIRFGTLRAKERDCFNLNFKILNATATQPMRCWGDSNGDFSLATEETAPYGTGPDKFTWNGTGTEPAAGPTAVADERSVLGSSYRTGHERVYATPAYWVLLPNHDADQALHNILYMKDHGYVDEQTRAVFVDFTVYNPMMNYWSIFRFVAESPKAGGMLMSHQLTTVRLYSVFESEILHWLVLEIIVICFFLYFILEQVPKIRQEGRAYLKQMSTMAHNANIIAYLLVWGFRFGAIAMLPPQDEIALDSDVFYQFRMASVYKSLSVYFNSLNAFLCWFKLVRYLSYIPRFALVTGTLVKSARGVSGFAVVFCVVFYGFAAAHMMTFGGRVHGYRNLTSSVYTLLKSLLGEFNLDEMTRAQWFMGPLFFVLFIALAVFVVLNVLIAIISDAYAEQSAELKESVDTEMGRDIVKYIHSVVLQTPCGRGARLGAQSLDKSRRIMVSKMSSRAGWEGELTARNKSHVSRSATVSPSGVGAVRATPTTAATAWAASEHKGDQRDVPESADGRSQPVDVEAKAAVTLPAL